MVVASFAAVSRPVVARAPSWGLYFAGAAALATVVVAGLVAVERGRERVALGLLVVGLVLALVLTATTTEGGYFLGTMPVLALTVFAGSLRAGVVLAIAFAAFVAGVEVHRDAALAVVLGRTFAYGSAGLFVLAFSQMVKSERAARARVQALATELEAANASLAEANVSLRTYAAEIEELSAAKERVRIAREIHDGIGHGLTVVNVQMEAARALLAVDPEKAGASIDRAQAVARESLAEVRRSVGMLRAPSAAGPLVDRVAAVVREHDPVATLEVEGEPRALGPAAEFAIYRAAQEALTNVHKHARAKSARVVLSFDESEVSLVVSDDGVGAAASSGGFGLVGMRERAELLGGRVEITSAPGKGFAVTVSVPG